VSVDSEGDGGLQIERHGLPPLPFLRGFRGRVEGLMDSQAGEKDNPCLLILEVCRIHVAKAFRGAHHIQVYRNARADFRVGDLIQRGPGAVHDNRPRATWSLKRGTRPIRSWNPPAWSKPSGAHAF